MSRSLSRRYADWIASHSKLVVLAVLALTVLVAAGATVGETGSAGVGEFQVDTEETWRHAADCKFRYSPALGDAFALGTAVHVDGTLLVGADDDFDAITDVPVVRFRADGA